MSFARVWKWATSSTIGVLVLIALAAGLSWLLQQLFGKGFNEGLAWVIGFFAVSFYASRVDSQLQELREENETLRGNLRGLEQSVRLLREDMQRET